jgi:hypothetical protein
VTQWYGVVLGALAASVLFLFCVEMRTRTGRRRRHRTRRDKPMFQVQRNGRIRFELEDLRRSAAATRRPPRPDPYDSVPDLEDTLPDLRRAVADHHVHQVDSNRIGRLRWPS